MPHGGSPPLQSGGQNHRWPTSGQGGYINPAAWGVPTASKRGAESEVAHKWARWLHNPCRLEDKISIGCLTLAFSGPKRGRKCYVTPAFSGIPNKGEQNQKWLPHPLLLFFVGSRSRIKKSVGRVTKKHTLLFLFQRKA